MAKRQRKLGRGLSSLIGPEEPVKVDVQEPASARPPVEAPNPDPTPSAPDSPNFVWVLIDSVSASPFQPRKGFDPDALKRLADSIAQSGLMQPIVVRSASGGGWELVAGERRLRAARIAGLDRIPALVREVGDEQAAELGLVENVQREDLNPMERAWALRTLSDRFGLSHGEVAKRVGLERSSVANLVRLTELEEPVQELLSSGALSAGHGKALLAAPGGDGRVRLAERASKDAWSVRRLEQAAKGDPSVEDEARSGRVPSEDLLDLERRLGEHLGTKVRVRTDTSGKRGKLVIEFFDLEHFDDLMSRIGYQGDSV